MKMKPLAVLVVLLSLLVSMTFGCQAQFQPGTYTDDTGRGVAIDEIPQRIVSFGPSITEILFALGLGERVVGVSDFSDYPEEAKSKPSVGSAYSPSIEKLVELEPDLVFTVEHEQLNSELEALGIKFLILDPDDIDGIFSNIELAGAVTGTEDEAAELIDSMEDTINYVLAQVEGAAGVSVFFIVDATDPTLPWTSGPGSFIDALITMAGGENIAAGAPGNWVQFSIEEIVGSDPEIIIIQTMTGGVPTVSIEELEEHPIWGEMTAVIQGNVFLIDGDLVSRPGPRIVQGLEELARIIHPELFE
jgi:iron complex transport system substrate-binding protein